MNFALVGPKIWRPRFLARARAAGADRQAAEALLRLSHSNGLGVPVDVCFDFIGWLNRQPGAERQWDSIFAALFSNPSTGRIEATQRDVLHRFQHNPFDAVSTLFWPVMSYVLDRIGSNILYVAASPPEAEKAQKAHDAHLTDVDRTLRDLSDPSGLAEHKAFQLSLSYQLAQLAVQGSGQANRSPGIDQLAARLFAAAGLILESQKPPSEKRCSASLRLDPAKLATAN